MGAGFCFGSAGRKSVLDRSGNPNTIKEIIRINKDTLASKIKFGAPTAKNKTSISCLRENVTWLASIFNPDGTKKLTAPSIEVIQVDPCDDIVFANVYTLFFSGSGNPNNPDSQFIGEQLTSSGAIKQCDLDIIARSDTKRIELITESEVQGVTPVEKDTIFLERLDETFQDQTNDENPSEQSMEQANERVESEPFVDEPSVTITQPQEGRSGLVLALLLLGAM